VKSVPSVAQAAGATSLNIFVVNHGTIAGKTNITYTLPTGFTNNGWTGGTESITT
jgi:hypothetical protein